jgi:hypothetical protein
METFFFLIGTKMQHCLTGSQVCSRDIMQSKSIESLGNLPALAIYFA